MTKRMLIDAVHAGETRMVIADEEFIEDFDFVTSSKKQVKGNIYLAKITRVEPSLQAAFVEYGGGKQGFLPFSEIHPDYYQIPVADRKRLIEEEAAETAREEAEEEEEIENRESRQDGRGGGDRKGGRRGGRYGRNRRGRGRNRDDQDNAENTQQDESGEEAVAADQSDQPQDNGDDTSYQAAAAATHETSSEPLPEEPSASEEHPESDDEAQVETVSDDDVEETRSRRKGASFKRYRIQEVIKRNQIVLVQVIKEERGNKGVSLSTYVSLAGRYCVLMPNSPKAGGVSRKIGNGEQRKKLKEIVAELRDNRGLSAIIRTAGIDRTKAEIKRDYEYLVKLWQQIREDTLASTAPALIYEESDIIKRGIRDLYTNDIEQILVQGEQAYKDAKTFMKMIMPSHAPRVKQYKDGQPIFSQYGIEEQLDSMFDASARLPSGGYIVLHPTEALISIDVNSGRSTTERNVEETAIKTNLEAAREIARQLRLRDLAGLVVIDFIDMYYGRNRKSLEKAMKDALKHDRAKIQMGRISAFGLMELSRQRLRPSLAESSSVMCKHCEGTGTVRSVETVAIQIIRLLEREAVPQEYTQLKVIADSDVVLHMFNHKRDMILLIEEQYNLKVVLEIDNSLLTGKFRLMKTTEEGKEILHQEDNDRDGKRKGRRGRRGGRNRGRDEFDQRPNNAPRNDDEEADDTEEEQAAETSDTRQDDKGKRRSKVRDDESGDTSEATAPAGDDEGESATRPRRRSRGNRGGRDRRGGRRQRGPRDGEAQNSASQEGSADITADNDNQPDDAPQVAAKPEPRTAEPRAAEPHTPEPRTQRTPEPRPEPKAHEPEPTRELEMAEAEDSGPPKPKRRGWWNK